MTTELDTHPTTTPPRVPVLYLPESAVFWVYVASVVIGSYMLITGNGRVIGETVDAQVVLGPVWALFVVALVWLIFEFDPYRSVRRYPQGLVAGTALGATIAVSFAIPGNESLEKVWARYIAPDTFAAWSAALTAPIIEELAKATCGALILVLCASVFNRISHALLVGMFVGLGFDVIEDLTYAAGSAVDSLNGDVAGASSEMAGRILSSVPSHWAFAALSTVGVLLLLPSFSQRAELSLAKRVPLALGLFASAWFMHFFWDSPLMREHFFLKIAINVAIFLAWAIWLQRYESRWVSDRIAALRHTSTADTEILDSLPNRKLRRALRKQARRSGGRSAVRELKRRQRAVLDEIQASG
jgi:protease PrsW